MVDIPPQKQEPILANPNDNADRVLQQTGQAVEQTMAQTRGAMEQYFNFIQNALSSSPFGGSELTEKMQSFTADNIASAQKFVQKLGQAKDFQDAMQIQTEYMQSQFQAFGEQTRSLAESFTKATTGAVKNPFRNY
jgi:hypothetical protein